VNAFSALNASGGAAGSGSLQLGNDFPNSPGGYNQTVFTGPLAGEVDAETLYTNISMDVRLDPSSYPRVDGINYGAVELILRWVLSGLEQSGILRTDLGQHQLDSP